MFDQGLFFTKFGNQRARKYGRFETRRYISSPKYVDKGNDCQ
jgi:hypothetical protein